MNGKMTERGKGKRQGPHRLDFLPFKDGKAINILLYEIFFLFSLGTVYIKSGHGYST